jgi:hypothetical protein
VNNKDTLKWFVRGFALTLLIPLVAMVVTWPSLGRAQGGNGDSPSGPEGQVAPVPIADEGEPQSNGEAMVPADAASQLPEPGEPAQEEMYAAYISPLVVPAADFTSDGYDPDGFHFLFDGGYVDGTGTACLKAPAYLPNGATVVSVYASLYDNWPDTDIGVNLRRVNTVSGASSLMGTLWTDGASTSIQSVGDTSIDGATTNATYAYYLTTCLNSAQHRLYSVRIYYTGP